MSEHAKLASDSNASGISNEPGNLSATANHKQQNEKDELTRSSNSSMSGDAKHGENNTPESVNEQEEKNTKQHQQVDVQQKAPKYTLEMGSTVLNPVVGDNPHVTIHHYENVIQGMRINVSKDDEDNILLDPNAANLGKLISNILTLERKGSTYFPEKEATLDTTKLPETEEEFSIWFYELSDYEQSYVQAAAVLHGAPVHEVSNRADMLYKRLTEHVAILESSFSSEPQSSERRETQQRGTPRFSETFLHKLPGRKLRIDTHTITRRIDGVERLYWQDVDSHGLSKFGLHLLDFLTSEFISRGEHGQIFLKVLEEWLKDINVEVSWKAARSFGVILWCHDTDRLGSTAERWAKEDSLRSRRRSAELLDGAFEIECLRTHATENGSSSSIVLSLLNNWIDRVHKEFRETTSRPSRATINLGCAVASAYGWIGQRSPVIALDGLECLLKLPQSRATNETQSIFAAGVSTYVTLIWSGHVRFVLERLAANAEKLSHQRNFPLTVIERQQYRRHREVFLNGTFEAFFLIAAVSMTSIGDKRITSYSLTESFPANPAIPDPCGRDVLLTGVLSANDVRKNVTILLCAAILEQKSGLAFGLMRYWTEVILGITETQSNESSEIYLSFQQFVVNLGESVNKWCLDLREQGFRSPEAFDGFKNRLQRWRIGSTSQSNPIGAFAQEVLEQLSN
jgi:hypothetical protein